MQVPKTPDFSIIIPTHNRPVALRRCLECVFAQDYDRDGFEVLVVDDGSDLSYSELQLQYPEVRWLRTVNEGPALARNTAAKLARGRYLAFVDDDCYATRHWLRELSSALGGKGKIVVGGATPAAPGANIYDRVSQFITLIVYLHYNADAQKSQFFASNNLAISTALFEDIGGFDGEHTRHAAEDRTLCNTVLSLNYPLVWQRDAVVFHHPYLNFRKFCHMYFRYGRGAFTYQSSRKIGGMLSEVNFHLQLPSLIRQGFSQTPALPLIPTLLLLGAWQVSNTLGFFWQSTQGTRY